MNDSLVLILSLLLLLPGTGAGDATPFSSFERLTTADGLVGSTVLAVVQDDQGFIWLGTQQGLNRYDGYRFKSYSAGAAPDGLSNANVRALLVDAAGALWIGTFGGGLNRLDPATGGLAHYRPSAAMSVAGDYDYVVSLAAGEQGELWLATRGGLVQFDPAGERFTPVTATAVNSVVVAGGRVWLGEESRVRAYRPETEEMVPYRLPDTAGEIYALLPEATGRLWIGAGAGLWLLEGEQPVSVPAIPPETAVIALLAGEGGGLWVGTQGAGLYRLDAAGRVAQQYRNDEDDVRSLSGDYVMSLYRGRDGFLWAGTWTEGVSLLVPRKFPRHLKTAPPLAFAPAGDGTWLGTFGEGLWRLGSEGEVVAVYRHDEAEPDTLASDIVFTLLAEPDGGLWVGTLAGLDYLPPGAGAFVHYRHDPAAPASLSDNVVRTLLRDHAGNIWVGTRNGLNRFEPETNNFTRFSWQVTGVAGATLLSVLDLHEDESGRLWVAGEGGLSLLAPGSGEVRVYNTNNSNLCHNFITAIQPGDGGLWLGSWGGGLSWYEPATDSWRCYRRDDGLADNVVLAIAVDREGNLWLSTPQGLSHFTPARNQFQTFTTADGLPDDGFVQAAVMQQQDGTLWFGNSLGILRFRPDEIGRNDYVPPVMLTAFYLGETAVEPGATAPLQEVINRAEVIHLPYDQNSLSFEFAALNYLNPAQNEYAYRLEGFDRDWIAAGQRRFVTYTNLDPGAYTFRVIASNDDGVWNEEGAAVRLLIAAPWWRRWWAYLGYGLLALLLVAGIVEGRTRVQRRALRHERRLRERLELIDSMKEADRARISRELHDGLAQTLAGLRFRARVWKTLLEQEPERLGAELDELGAILDETIQDVRRSIFALRPATVEEMGLVRALEQMAQTLSQQYQLQVHIRLPDAGEKLEPGLELNLFRIGSELLSNAARHAAATAVWLELVLPAGEARLVVRDDGQGFNPALLPQFVATGHLGLRHLQERVALLGGTFAIESSAAAGTRVTVSLPRVQEA